MTNHADKPPETLWHYTDFKGLQGILNGNLWASSIAFLNDSQEFSYAINVAREVLTEDDMESEIKGIYDSSLDTAAEMLNDIFALEDGTNVFASSFSAKADDLSQWRAYGGTGPSMSIGFSASRLRTVAAGVGFELVRVEYDREEIAATFRTILRNYYRSMAHCSSGTKPHALRPIEFTLNVVIPLIELAGRSKDASFLTEEEWRLVAKFDPPTTSKPKLPFKFRQSGSLVVPYVEIPLQQDRAIPAAEGRPSHSVINSVVIGPSPHPKQLKHAVEQMVKNKAEHIEVESSQVPFRNW